MNVVKKIASEYIGAAQTNPRQAPEILRRAAATFASLADQQKNPRAVKRLTDIGFEFAGAAMKAQAQQAQAMQAQEQNPTTSDFTQLMHDTAQAWDELGPDAAFSTAAAMDATAIQRTNVAEEVVRSVSAQPYSFLNKDVTLGRIVSITFNPTQEQITQGIAQSQTVAFWQGVKRESQAMTIDFGTVFPPNAFTAEQSAIFPPVVDCRPYALIQYGADGNTQNSVSVDLNLGRRISIVGNYASVIVGMDPPRDVPDIEASSPVISVGASIGTYAATSIAPVIRTVYVDAAPVNAVVPQLFPIPLRAVQMLPPLAASPTDTLTIGFFTFNGVQIGSWQSAFSPATPFWVPYPVPADAYYISVRSLQGVPTGANGRNGIRIPFELSL